MIFRFARVRTCQHVHCPATAMNRSVMSVASLRLHRSGPSDISELETRVRHTICLVEAPVTLKKLISVSLNVYLEVHHILCNSHGTFQKSARCPCRCTPTLLPSPTALIIMLNSSSGFDISILMLVQASAFMSFTSLVCLQASTTHTLWSADCFWSRCMLGSEQSCKDTGMQDPHHLCHGGCSRKRKKHH